MSQNIEMIDNEVFVMKTLEPTEIKMDGEGRIVAIVSTEAEDGEGDIVRQRKNKKGAGWLLDHYNKNPVITWQHDMWIPSLSGPETRAKVAKHATLGQVLTLDPMTFDKADPFAEFIGGKVERKVVKEFSVGFRGKVVERRAAPEGQYNGREFFEQALVEVAVANRGMNPETEAEVKAAMSGIMARHPEIALKSEGGDDNEIQELKDELADAITMINDMGKAMALMNDNLTGKIKTCEVHFSVLENIKAQDQRRNKAVKGIYDSLCRKGTAHG